MAPCWQQKCSICCWHFYMFELSAYYSYKLARRPASIPTGSCVPLKSENVNMHLQSLLLTLYTTPRFASKKPLNKQVLRKKIYKKQLDDLDNLGNIGSAFPNGIKRNWPWCHIGDKKMFRGWAFAKCLQGRWWEFAHPHACILRKNIVIPNMPFPVGFRGK